jgi:hypothetical protein
LNWLEGYLHSLPKEHRKFGWPKGATEGYLRSHVLNSADKQTDCEGTEH